MASKRASNGHRKKSATRRKVAEVEQIREAEVVDIGTLKDHPQNYREHPEDQLLHIMESLRTYGYYRNIVTARDGTILAGHGVVKGARKLKWKRAPIYRLDLAPNDALALKIVAADNELGKFAESDDRRLTDLLKEISEKSTSGLLGTGYDQKMLAALLMNTRPASEIRSVNEAAHWVGLPSYDEGGPQIKLVVNFLTEEDRVRFVREQGLQINKIAGLTWSTRWPFTTNEDVGGVKFEVAGGADA